jgi:peptidoglycan/LPS O-acetylase OafA/YrhL
MQTPEVKRYKLVQLEAVRGIASVVVVFHHFVLAFLPGVKASAPTGYFVAPWQWVINGEGAVSLFFVLSGFVLTRRYFETPPAFGDVTIAAAKRFPRLFLPASASILLGYSLLAFGGRPYMEAGRLTDSWWLSEFGGSAVKGNFVPSLSSALQQCFGIFLVKQQTMYSSNLWTMRPEPFGSLVWAFIPFTYVTGVAMC